MHNPLKTSIALVLGLTFLVGTAAQAQTNPDTTNVSSDTNVQTNTQTNVPAVGATPTQTPVRSGAFPPPQTLRRQNLEQNKEIRNKLIEDKKNIIEERTNGMQDLRTERNTDLKDLRNSAPTPTGSTTPMMARKQIIEKFQDSKGKLLQKAKRDEVTIRQEAIVKELTLRVTNLQTTSTRVDAYLTKIELTDTSTVEIRAALVVANEKITAAKVAVEAFATWKPTETGAGSTTEVSLAKPRAAADVAIKAIKDAGDALRTAIGMMDKAPKRPAGDRPVPTASTNI